MLFNSIEFFLFFFALFILYWTFFAKNVQARNMFILLANYVFYGWWDWRFLSIILFISGLDYWIGLYLARTTNPKRRKTVFIIALFVNVGILFFFKYFNFFIDSFIALFQNFGMTMHAGSLNIILPVGISYYTFLSLSYLIDVYRHRKTPTSDIVALFASLSFFPIILAGPIHRPMDLISQFGRRHQFHYATVVDGMRQALWGLFKKLVIADTCAQSAALIFSHTSQSQGSDLFLGAVFFAIQIYGDFSGYSDMAIGISRMLGFDIVRNFAYPYFARDIKAFWQRWHISLTQWFRDYVFLPLSFSLSRKIKGETLLRIKSETWIYIIGSLITWALTGFWHGANWTFLIWGMFHAILLIIYQVGRKPYRKLLKRVGVRYKNRMLMLCEWALTFFLTTMAWVFFRSDSLGTAIGYLKRIFSASLFTLPTLDRFNVLFILILFVIEWIGRNHDHPLKLDRFSWMIRWVIYLILGAIAMGFFSRDVPFLYMQF